MRGSVLSYPHLSSHAKLSHSCLLSIKGKVSLENMKIFCENENCLRFAGRVIVMETVIEFSLLNRIEIIKL